MVWVNEAECVGCGHCQPSCPEEAISVWGMAKVDDGKCTECLECIDWCPVDALEARE